MLSLTAISNTSVQDDPLDGGTLGEVVITAKRIKKSYLWLVAIVIVLIVEWCRTDTKSNRNKKFSSFKSKY